MSDNLELPWSYYNNLIAEVPDDAFVRDVCVGIYWTYVEAEYADGRRSLGVAYTLTGGGGATVGRAVTGMTLKQAAELSKSWNWREASIGVAALNAWYTTKDKIEAMGAVFDPPHDSSHGPGAADLIAPRHVDGKLEYRASKTDPFQFMQKDYAGKKITVVGHFPWLERVAEIAELTILERNCRDITDTPDPACEYVIPTQDVVFMTGVTSINKTAPRLIALAKNAVTAMLGPSVIAAEQIFARGVDVLAGRTVIDSEMAKAAVKQDLPFGSALQMYAIDRRTNLNL